MDYAGDSTFLVTLPSGAPGGESTAGWGRKDCLGAPGSPCGARPRCALGDAGGREGEAVSRDLAAPGSPTGDTRVTGEGPLVCRGGEGAPKKLVTWRPRQGAGGWWDKQPPKMPERGVRAPHPFPGLPQPRAC